MNQHIEIFTIQNRKGIHARAAAKFVKTVESFDAKVSVRKLSGHDGDAQPISGSSILALMMLGAGFGEKIEVKTQGTQAEQALAGVRALVNGKFGEGE